MDTKRSPSLPALPGALASSPPSSRSGQLRLELLMTVDLLHRRRADQISEGVIDEYVALHWIEWNGGSLRLTETGTNVCKQLRAELA